MTDQPSLLLIVDYNLSRVLDVAHLATYAAAAYGTRTVLIRPAPGAQDKRLCERVIDLDPLAEGFVERALAELAPIAARLRAGLVFSDNAVQRGAELLERLGLRVDDAALADAAYCKRRYRQREARLRDLLEAQSLLVPAHAEVRSAADLRRFAQAHGEGFVVKPACEGNNRGVMVVRTGDDIQAAFDNVAPYLANGALCESLIPYEREFSFDGVGDNHFVTEKVSAGGPFPVEVAQLLPARISLAERATLVRAGRLANLLVGQRDGPFHNEIKLSDDGLRAAVVEPNRRPGGMKIWTIAQAVYGVDFYALWVDAAFGHPRSVDTASSALQAATVMLGVPHDGPFAPLPGDRGTVLFDQALAEVCAAAGLEAGALRRLEFAWLSDTARYLPAVPRDNADFAAQACIVLDAAHVDMRAVVTAARATWLSLLAGELPAPTLVRPKAAAGLARLMV